MCPAIIFLAQQPDPRMRTAITEVRPFVTKDDCEVRELMHPSIHGNRHQSLAQATVKSGHTTKLHKHLESEELYHITCGIGRMRLGDEWFHVAAGDTVLIPPGVPHQIRNCGAAPLIILCCCAPAYDDDDTVLLT